MSTITAILEVDADGTLHLPVPEELRGGKVKVAATLDTAESSSVDDDELCHRSLALLRELRARNPFKDIADPLAWQREMREDVVRPGRE